MTFFIGGVFIYQGCSKDLCIFSFLSLLDTLSLVHWSCDHLTYIVLIFGLYILMYVISPISPCVVSFLSLYTCFLLNVCNLLFLFHTKIP